MASSAVNPRPPGPVQRQRSPGKVLLIVVLVLATIIAASIFAIYVGIRILTHTISVRELSGASGSKQVSIKTPVGSLEIHQSKQVSLGMLGLPVYPGARRLTDDGNASLTANFGSQNLVGVLAAKFETDDPIQRVRTFYHDQLGGRVTRYIQKDSEGKMVFEIKSGGQEKIVALREKHGGTQIELIRLVHSSNEVN
jgi:hypothetical protein